MDQKQAEKFFLDPVLDPELLLRLFSFQLQETQKAKQQTENRVRKTHIEDALQHHKEQQHYFDELRQLYDEYKKASKPEVNNDNWEEDSLDLDNLATQQTSIQKIHLPDLKIYPKDLPRPPQQNEFLVRKTVLEYFRKFEEWDEEKFGAKYGYYFSGPNGVGKSVAVYFIACLARAHNWFVIYMPACDAWVQNSPSSTAAMQVLIAEIARGAAPFCETPLKGAFIADPGVKTLGDLLVAALATTNSTTVEFAFQAIRHELEEWNETPLLLIFDEVNALFTMTQPWLNGTLPKDHTAFGWAASLNRMKLTRGWKLITGTGHERFLNEIQPAIGKWVRNWLPYSRQEFNDLLNTVGHPWLLKTLNSIKKDSVRKALDIRIKTTLGCVPRQLYELGTYLIEKVFVHNVKSISPEDYFHDKGLTGPQEQIGFILEEFQQEAQKLFLDDCYSYLQSLQEADQTKLLRNLLSLFFPRQEGNTVVFSRRYLDRSLVYIDESNQYHFLTPAAQSAILQVLREQNCFKNDPDEETLFSPLRARDEKARPFERCFAKRLLLQSSSTALTVNVQNFARVDLDPLKLECKATLIIPNSLWCPRQEILVPTLLVPQSENYPIADFVLYNPIAKSITILQLTLQDHIRKAPHHKPYGALWNHEEWDALKKNHQQRNVHSSSRNYIEELFHCLGFQDIEISIPEGATSIQVSQGGEQSEFAVHWVIVCPHELPQNNHQYQELAAEYPWVMILNVESLRLIIGTTVVDALSKTELR